MNGSHKRSLRCLVISFWLIWAIPLQLAYAMKLIDLSKTPADVQIVTGGMGKALSAENIAVGDINGDGIDDIIVRGWANQGAEGHGMPVIAVVFGKRTLPTIISLAETAPDIRISLTGTRSAPYQDPAAFVGDINGDQIGDLVIPTEEGLAVFWGRNRWPAQIDLAKQPPDFRVVVQTTIEEGGIWRGLVAIGDINKDGIGDLVFSHGAIPKPPASHTELSVSRDRAVRQGVVGWIFWGKKSWPNHIDVTTQGADTVISGPQGDPRLGNLYRLKVADFNGDGFGDILVGSWDGGENNGISGSRQEPWTAAWIIPGAGSLPGKIKLVPEDSAQSSPGPVEASQKQVVHIDFHSQGLFVEGGLFAGDLVRDDKADIGLAVIRKPLPPYVPHREFCIIPGSFDLFKRSTLDTRKHCIMIRGKTIQRIGPMQVPQPIIGDFNGDGKNDLFVLSLSSQEFMGLFGHKTYSPVVDIDASTDVKILPPLQAKKQENIPVGYGMTSAMGDVNGDKRADLLVVVPLDRGGAVHIVLGKST